MIGITMVQTAACLGSSQDALDLRFLYAACGITPSAPFLHDSTTLIVNIALSASAQQWINAQGPNVL